jgi:arabinose-5-phosphate isomerase
VGSPAAGTLKAIASAVAGLMTEDMELRIAEVVQLILRFGETRVIVTGMGKCSHVGRKIAATLQSTGQPAAFLHPGEALHGDMGMIIPARDVILALSNSGRTDEVLKVCGYAKRNGNPVVAITAGVDSPLWALAFEALPIPAGPEGCPIGRAPMASTACIMALGDALAAELMVRRQFTERDFLELHHGGYLGRVLAAQGGR